MTVNELNYRRMRLEQEREYILNKVETGKFPNLLEMESKLDDIDRELEEIERQVMQQPDE
jgi:hypothetical protein